MFQGWETPTNPCADGAENKHRGQVGISHQCSAQQATPFIYAVDIPRYRHHQIIRQWETGVLSPPAIESHSYIKTCTETIKQKRHRVLVMNVTCLDHNYSFGLTKYERNWNETDISKLITIKGNPLKQILLLRCEHKPAM